MLAIHVELKTTSHGGFCVYDMFLNQKFKRNLIVYCSSHSQLPMSSYIVQEQYVNEPINSFGIYNY